MKILIGCEYSGVVRDAFKDKGHDAWSCDISLPETDGNFLYGDVYDALKEHWDMAIFHPPCTFLTTTGNSWFYHPDDKHLPYENRRPHPRYPDRRQDQKLAIKFFMDLANSNINKICIENPLGIMSTMWRSPDQIIQPFQFGHKEPKRTCLWLKNLPLLKPTKIVEPEYTDMKSGSGKRMPTWYMDAAKLSKHERMKIRSKTFQGIADAFANQWG